MPTSTATSPLLTRLFSEQPETGLHGLRVWRYAAPLARKIGLPHGAQKTLEAACILHDIGKLEVPRGVLDSPAALTLDERRVMKGHVASGHRLVSRGEGLGEVASVLAMHHERLDGQGYPHGLSGKEIPLAARVLSIADTFDAMTATRPYRRALSYEVAVEELLRASSGRGVSGGQLDGELVLLFIRQLERARAPEGEEPGMQSS